MCIIFPDPIPGLRSRESRDAGNSSAGNTVQGLFAITPLGAEIKLLANRAIHQLDPALILVLEEQRVDRVK